MQKRKGLVKAYNWYENEGGKEFFEKHTNITDFIEIHYTTTGTREVSGVYIIYFNDIPAYIGESSQMGVRFIEHILNLVTGTKFWGSNDIVKDIESKKLELKVDVLKNNLTDEAKRVNKEIEMIAKYKPFLQNKTNDRMAPRHIQKEKYKQALNKE